MNNQNSKTILIVFNLQNQLRKYFYICSTLENGGQGYLMKISMAQAIK